MATGQDHGNASEESKLTGRRKRNGGRSAEPARLLSAVDEAR